MDAEDWCDVNKGLRHHGLPIIIPSSTEIISSREKIVFDKQVAVTIQENILSLIKDSERRHELIKDLLITNNRLKEEASLQMKLAAQFQTRVIDLKNMMENVKLEKQELETKYEQSRNFKNKVDMVDSETKDVVDLDSYHFQEIYKKLQLDIKNVQNVKVMCHSKTDFLKEANLNDDILKINSDRVPDSESSESYFNSSLKSIRLTDNFIKDFSDQFSETSNNEQSSGLMLQIENLTSALTKSQEEMKKVETQFELLKLELNSRPDIQVFRKAQNKIKKLEKLLAHSKKNHVIVRDTEYISLLHNLKVEDISNLSLTASHQLIKDLAAETKVEELSCLVSHVRNQSRILNAYPKMTKLLNDVLTEVIPLKPSQQVRKHEIWCDTRWRDVIPTIRHWRQNTKNLEHLQKAVNSLIIRHFPQHQRLPIESGNNVKLNKLISILNILSKDCRETKNIYKETSISSRNLMDLEMSRNKQECRHDPSYSTLLSMVQHFQTLFDVSSLNGVYPRMQEIFCQLGEINNILNTLRTILDLDKRAKIASVVDVVTDMKNTLCGQEYTAFKQLTEKESFDSILAKLQQHHKFLPVFQTIILQIMDIVGVEDINKVLPAVQLLKGI